MRTASLASRSRSAGEGRSPGKNCALSSGMAKVARSYHRQRDSRGAIASGAVGVVFAAGFAGIATSAASAASAAINQRALAAS
jgi:hypothetical protein